MYSVQECKTKIVRIIDRLPDSKIEELLDYASFLSSRYSTPPESPDEREVRLNDGEEFMDIFGIWSKADLEEFNKAVSDFRKIDPDDWT